MDEILDDLETWADTVNELIEIELIIQEMEE